MPNYEVTESQNNDMAITDKFDNDNMTGGITVKVDDKDKSYSGKFTNESVKQAVS